MLRLLLLASLFLASFCSCLCLLFCLISPSRCGFFWKSEEGKKKKAPMSTLGLLRLDYSIPPPNPSANRSPLLAAHNCRLPAPEAGTSRSTVLQVFRDLGGFALPGATAAVCERSTLGVFRAALHLGPLPGSSHAGSLATFPRNPPKVVSVVIRGRLVSCAAVTPSSGPAGSF